MASLADLFNSKPVEFLRNTAKNIGGVGMRGTDALIDNAITGSPVTVQDFSPVQLPSTTKKQEINNALGQQKKSIDEATRLQGDLFDRLLEINKPTMDMGEEQQKLLLQGVQSGAFLPTQGLYDDFQQYIAPQYQQQAPFDYDNRQQFQGQAPLDYQIERAQGQLPQMDTSGRPQLSAPQQLQTSAGTSPALGNVMQLQAQRTGAPVLTTSAGIKNTAGQAPTFTQPQQFRNTLQAPVDRQFTGRRVDIPAAQQFAPNAYAGRDVQTNVQGFRSNQNVDPRFKTQMMQQQALPDVYTAGNAPTAQYYNPNAEQFQRREFQLENDHAYQEALKQSQRAIQAQTGAAGMQLSGSALKALQDRSQAVASNYTGEAYGRYQADEASRYQQFADRQAMLSGEQRYQNTDQLQRYLSEADIRASEQDKRIANFQNNRSFQAQQNTEQFSREALEKELGMKLTDQQYQQFADRRALQISQGNTAAAQDMQRYQFDTGTNQQAFNNYQALQQANTDRADTRYNTDFAQTMAQNEAARANYADTRNFNYQANQAYQQNLQNYDANRRAAYESDRGYNTNLQQQNIQNEFDRFGILQNAYESNRDYNTNLQQQNIQNQFTQYGLNRDAFTQDRAYTSGQQQQNIANQFAYDQMRLGQYQNDIGNQFTLNDQQQRYYDTLNQGYESDRSYTLQQNQQNFANAATAYGINNENYNTDRAFNYNQYQNQGVQDWQQYQYNNQLRAAESANQYSMNNDAYTRNAARGQQQYAMLGDLVNLGSAARATASGVLTNYYDAMSNAAISKGNAAAAAAAARGNVGMFW